MMRHVDPNDLVRSARRQRMFDTVARRLRANGSMNNNVCAWEALIEAGYNFDQCIRDEHDLTLRLFWDYDRGDWMANMRKTAREFGLSAELLFLEEAEMPVGGKHMSDGDDGAPRLTKRINDRFLKCLQEFEKPPATKILREGPGIAMSGDLTRSMVSSSAGWQTIDNET